MGDVHSTNAAATNSSDDQEEQAEQGQNVEQVVTPQVVMVTNKAPLESTNEEPEPAQDIEIPPPMEIQDHTFKAAQEPPMEEVSTKLASTLSLKQQQQQQQQHQQQQQQQQPSAEAGGTADLANEMENMIFQRMDQPTEVVPKSDSGPEDEDDKSAGTDAEGDKAKYLKKRQFVLQELVDTEKDYVKDLGCVVDGYMTLMKETPFPEEGKDKIIFGNIHQIYDWHKETFQPEIEKISEEPERLGMIFVRYERRLYMYVKYCENKPKSEYIVAEYLETFFEDLRQKLGHKLTLPDLLIKPVQRIMKYQLLLKDIAKYTERAGLDVTDLKKALRVMNVVPKAANDMMQVGRLQGFNGKITAQGKLLLQDTLLVSEISGTSGPQKFKERRVFLFEQIIIFSEMTEKRKGDFSNANYVFKNSVKVNKMSMSETVEGEPFRFVLVDRTPGSDMKFYTQAPSEEVKQTWIREIKSILDMQGDFLRALQSPIAYQKELTKEMSAPEFGSLPRESALRKTHSHPQQAKGVNPIATKSKGGRHDSKKHERCKSVPAPLPELPAEDASKSSCPNSPTETSKDPTNPDRKLGDGGAKKMSASGGSTPSSETSSGVAGSPKPKKTIFEGFRNTLGKKNKNDSVGGGNSSNTGGTRSPEVYANTHSMPDVVQDSDGGRTFSAGSAEPCAGAKQLTDSPGSEQSPLEGGVTEGRIIVDYVAIKEDEISVFRGELVQILATNPTNMFLVHRAANHNSPAAEGWIPGHILGPKDMDGSLKKHSWQMFKLKKPSFRPDKSADGLSSLERKAKSLGRDGKPKVKVMSPGDFNYEVPPIVQQPLTSVTVQAGDTAVLTCKICGRPRPSITWRFNDATTILPGPRILLLYNEEGVATLQISQVSLSDAGEYSCFASSDIGSIVTRANLTVLDRPGAPGQPVIRNQVGTAVHLEWSPPPNSHCGQIQGYTVEFREKASGVWQLAIPYVPNTSQVIGDLEPGITYQFRVSANNAVGISEPSPASVYVAVPTEYELSAKEEATGAIWKATYDNDFGDAGEIGRGRFAVVRKCIQKCSGQELAAKVISRKLVRKEAVETEFNTLQSLQHSHLVQAYDLYESHANLIIIMQLLPHGRLLEYICSKPHFDEIQAAEYMRQLLDVVQYLHNCRIAHLDIKPENLLVEVGAMGTGLKLTDFGDARHIYNNYYIHPIMGNTEFMSPELISGTPVGLLTDIWSIGVIVYVLLSGVSPFLDESQEETCSNIVRNDYCFPDEYFAGISQDAKDLIRTMLVEELSKRPSAQTCIECAWIKKASVPRSSPLRPKPIATARLCDFIERRRHQSDTIKVIS